MVYVVAYYILEWSLYFWASTPMLYVKNKMAEASFLPQRKGKFFSFSAIVGCFLFQDI